MFANIKDSINQVNQRFLVALALVMLLFVILIVRLAYLQIIQHNLFDNKAENNRTSLIPDPPLRGEIFDRNGTLLAGNTINYSLEVVPGLVKNLEQTLTQLTTAGYIDAGDISAFKPRRKETKRLEPVILRLNLTAAEMAKFAANSYLFPGVEINARYFRQYPLAESASHVIGYIGRINQNDKEQLEDADKSDNYRGTSNIGKHGLETSYEDSLHGKVGLKTVEISASGRVVRELNTQISQQGNDLHLSIDIKLQQLIEQLYGDRMGSAVVMDVNNGELLALVSKPTFDPNLFVNGIDVENWRKLNESIQRPMFNRAVRGTYSPGSTYKPFMALAALETGSRSASTIIKDQGYWELGNRKYRNPGLVAMGNLDMKESLVRSSNVYYYSLAYEMGVEKIYAFMSQLGFGKPTGIDLRSEASGVLPNKQWKAQRNAHQGSKDWFVGETVPLGIGQGYNNFTMLQMAKALATVVNGGVVPQPHLVRSLQQQANTKSNVLLGSAKQPPLKFKPEHVQTVLDAMVQVNLRGSAKGAFAGSSYSSGGKTGTTQVAGVPQGARYNKELLSEYKRDHSLFIGFVPAEQPKYVIALVVENAGWGGSAAAPIARKAFDYLMLESENAVEASADTTPAQPN